MEALDKKYLSELEEIKTKIQASAHLEKYLDEEEDDELTEEDNFLTRIPLLDEEE